LAMRGAAVHFNPSNRRGHIPLLQLATPWCNFWMEGGAEKMIAFWITFLKRKHLFGIQAGHFGISYADLLIQNLMCKIANVRMINPP
jgi:hypothetical protein